VVDRRLDGQRADVVRQQVERAVAGLERKLGFTQAQVVIADELAEAAIVQAAESGPILVAAKR
jgi:hypothetical protein